MFKLFCLCPVGFSSWLWNSLDMVLILFDSFFAFWYVPGSSYIHSAPDLEAANSLKLLSMGSVFLETTKSG